MEKKIESTLEQEKIEEFLKEYNELCGRYGYQVGVQPAWISTNHNSYELVANMIVVQRQ